MSAQNEIVERAARELHRAHYEIGRAIAPPYPTDRFEVLRWELMARAAIAALREPTEAMISEGYCEAGGTDADPEKVWKFMIDQALKPKGE